MTTRRILFSAGVGVYMSGAAFAADNVLTDQEAKDGWKLLWDGRSSDGWRSAASDRFPAAGWEMKDGVLTVLGKKGGDIVTRESYSNFELSFEFRLTPVGNSGVKYFVQPAPGGKGMVGLEFQILDDARHPDAKLGTNGDRTVSSLYDLMPAAASKKPSPIGEWNQGRIVSRGTHVEHWLNGGKVLEYERGSPAFRERIAASKYKTIPGFGEAKEGPILLQDHNDTVSFRNLKIRTFAAP